MTLKDHKGRENIVERFVNDLFAWLFHLVGWLVQVVIVTALFLLVIGGLAQCFSDEAQASPKNPPQLRETTSCAFSSNY